VEFSDIRPIISGLVGGLVAIGLAKSWERWVPKASGDKPAAYLLDTYRGAIRIANGLLACGGVAALSLYWLGWFDEHQWQPLGLGFGGGSTAALLALAVLPLVWGGAPRDAFVAYAISQRAPAWLLYFFMTALAASFPAAVWSLLA